MESPKDTALTLPESSPQESTPEKVTLLPPPTREANGQFLPGVAGTTLTRKLIRDTIRAKFRQNPEKFQEIMDKWIEDCTHLDPTVRETARKSLSDRLEGKPVQAVANDDENPVGSAVINFTLVPRRD